MNAFAYYNRRVRRRSALVAGLIVLAACSCTDRPPPPAAPHGWTLVAHAHVGQTPGPVLLAGQWAFVANMSDGTITQMRRSDAHVVATVKVADPRVMRAQGCAPDSVHAYYSGSWGWRACDTPYAIAWDGSALWALDNGTQSLIQLDPVAHRVDGTVRLPGTGWSIAIRDGVAYVSGFADAHVLYAVDLGSHAVTVIAGLDSGPATLIADASGVWVSCVRAATGHLDRIDPRTGQVTGRYPLEWWSTAITSAGGAVFVRGTFGGDISRIDPSTGAVTWTMPGPGFIGRQGIDQLAPAQDGVWMSGPTTSLVDLATGRISQTIPMPSETVAAGSGDVWLIELDGSVAKFALK